jgi:beta-glucosidase-like glycosyl hydrolase
MLRANMSLESADQRSIRYVKGVTVFPAGVHVASTWDTSLIYARGNAMGSEAKGVGVNVQLAPVAGKIPTPHILKAY